MPADNIKRAIQKGTGELPGTIIEEAVYEAYGPGGAAMIVEVTTDNKNRTTAEIRHMFSKHGGAFGASVAWLFNKKGYVVVEKDKADEEKLLELITEAGADDMVDDGSNWEILSAPDKFQSVVDHLKTAQIPTAAAIPILRCRSWRRRAKRLRDLPIHPSAAASGPLACRKASRSSEAPW